MNRSLIVFAALLLVGCSLKAPDVELKKPVVSVLASQGICASVSDNEMAQGQCGRLEVPMDGPERKTWVYWIAGTNNFVVEPSAEFIATNGWDMRMTQRFPIVGTNGGETNDKTHNPEGKAAIAVFPDTDAQKIPLTRDEVLGLTFVEDAFEGLVFEGHPLADEYQNRLVNQIGPGMVRSYDFVKKTVELSYRTFILRSADGQSYYAIRFSKYEKLKTLTFDWRKLQ